ncbi:MAG: NAD(P)-binding domain-containing protein [Chloroflexi bacterium]|nr:NAD(P)-binding domain-containing protein [Chloroflexota bacterium]MBI3167157.1 NAD(P)-binding domain-containing protein [Chloroflexota bacterium]
MQMQTDLLIIGAGPFGLSLAAYAKHLGIHYLVAGRPMEFWKKNMPDGMYLRSASDWSLDPTDRFSIMKYLESLGKTPKDVEPLSLEFYLKYAQWFQESSGIQTIPDYVTRLDQANGGFQAVMENGDVIEAKNVVIAIGMGYFKNQPSALTEILPEGRYEHTCDAVQLSRRKGRRVLILGGRQSAFEWAALLNDGGAAEVHVVHRHESPRFAEADWSWVPPLVDKVVSDPAWFRGLPQEEKDAINKRMWGEGRLKVEPWLEKRVMKPNTSIHQKASLASCTERADGALDIKLDTGDTFVVDDVILATGYKVDLDRLPFLMSGNVFEKIEVKNGFPVLDPHFQTSVNGLYFTSMPAGQDFGPFFGFTVSVRTSAKVIGNALVSK